MFPSAADKRAHKRAAARISKQKQAFEQRVSELRDPTQVVQFILAEASTQYRRGTRKIALNFAVPVANFVGWAASAGIIDPNEDDVYVKQLVSRPLIKQIRGRLKDEIEPNILKNCDCKSDVGINFAFEVEFSILS